MPRGRFWMKRMIRTRNRNLAKNRAGKRLQELVRHAEDHGAEHGTPKITDAAKHDNHEGIDDVVLAEVRADIVDLREGYACKARDSDPSPNVRASTRDVAMPMAAAMRRFCVTARISRPRLV